MLRRVTFPPFGNTNFDAIIPFSVTIIMSQFATLTIGSRRFTIGVPPDIGNVRKYVLENDGNASPNNTNVILLK